MQHDLFRQEAVEYQFAGNQGAVFLLPSLSARLLGVTMLVWVVALVWYLNSQQYKTFTRLNGWLEMSAGNIMVYPDGQFGRISHIWVQNGDIVRPGAPLLQIDSGQTLDNGENVHALVLDEYLVQQASLQQQLTDLSTTQQFGLQTLQTRAAQLEHDAENLGNLIALVGQRLTLAKNSEQSLKKLSDSRLAARNEYQQAARMVLSLQQEQLEYQREQAAKHAQYQEIKNDLARQPAQQRQERRSIEQQLSNLKNQILQWDSQHRRIITASVAGQVADVDIRLGEYIANARPLLSINPTDSQLSGKLLMPAHAAGQVKPGQPVRVKLDAFPYQQFGTIDGTVTRISEHVISAEARQRQPLVLNEPAFLVEISLAAQRMETFGSHSALRSGMTFSADVTTRETGFIEWLLSPLYSVKGAW